MLIIHTRRDGGLPVQHTHWLPYEILDPSTNRCSGLTDFQGTFGPMSSAFSICSLSQPWRMEILPGGGEQDITDPKWYTITAEIVLFKY
jgi:hypothetical protein